MADINNAARKFIGLTGTLLNGYADGLFYILYRTCPATMKEEGYNYEDCSLFQKEYGVVRNESRFVFRDGRTGQRIGCGSDKKLPGVSPLVFTKFLLENSVFLSLSDMGGGLPSYEEIPVSVEMDGALHQAYNDLERNLKELCSYQGNGIKVVGALLQTLSVYPDMPYNQPEIIHPDTGEVLFTPPDLGPGLRNKERKLLEMVQKKIAEGEKVLIYNEWTNKTDVATKLNSLLNENGINSAVLTSSIKAEERESWINTQLEKGLQVLICNPKLVETGLDLLDFTTIIFYQIGYNIFTLRQASRRSWRLSQTKPIKVYFLFYEDTIQAQALSLMATKLQASMAIEGHFSEEGLRAMSNNEDLLTQIANSVVQGIKDTVEIKTFVSEGGQERVHDTSRERTPLEDLLVQITKPYSFDFMNKQGLRKIQTNKNILKSFANLNNLLVNYVNIR